MDTTNRIETKPHMETLVITRIFDAPRALVWKAWTNPEHFMKWWGPEGFTSPAIQIDLKVGGKHLYCMVSPQGQVMWSTGVYTEIVPLERLVYSDTFSDAEGNAVGASFYGMEGGEVPVPQIITVTFEDTDDGKTKMTLINSEIPDATMIDSMNWGWNSSFEKMAESFK